MGKPQHLTPEETRDKAKRDQERKELEAQVGPLQTLLTEKGSMSLILGMRMNFPFSEKNIYSLRIYKNYLKENQELVKSWGNMDWTTAAFMMSFATKLLEPED